MLKSKLSFILILFKFISSLAQENLQNYQLGDYFDMSGQYIDGYYDVDYKPAKTLDVSYTLGDNFTPGCYYNSNNEKITGFIKFSQYNTFFQFRKDDKAEVKTIKPDECLGYIIGTDSFAVIQNFYVQREVAGFKSEEKEFAEVLDQFGSYVFYEHTRAGLNNIVTTYLVKKSGSDEYISFSKTKGTFIKSAVNVFNEYDFLNKSIRDGKYYQWDIPKLVKLYKYKLKSDKQEKIYFNSCWDEIDDANKSSYYATVKIINDSIFHLKYYFKNGIPVYEGNFTSFYPHIKTGRFIWYYPNGTIRKITNYINNELQGSIKTFFCDGKPHYEYKLQKKNYFFSKVYDSSGNNLLDSLGNGEELFHDSIRSIDITREFSQNKIRASHYKNYLGAIVYQICKKRAKLSQPVTINAKIKNKVKYPINAIQNYAHGIVLIRGIVMPSGHLSDIEIIKGIDNECDTTIKSFINFMKTEPIWWPAKIKNLKVSQEVVIPIDFSINGYSRYRHHYYWNNMFWMHQNMRMPTIKQVPKLSVPTYRF